MTSDSDALLQQVANPGSEKTDLPSPSELVTALLETEKIAKKSQISGSFAQLIGTWRLCFVTGTKGKKSGFSLGQGKYIPRFIQISLSYSPTEQSPQNQGKVENCVNLGLLQLSLTGPVKFLAPKNMLVFDFTRMNLKLFGANVYDGYIRSGEAREASFYTSQVSKQAFFTYFYISQSALAARGRGGGKALWSRFNN